MVGIEVIVSDGDVDITRDIPEGYRGRVGGVGIVDDVDTFTKFIDEHVIADEIHFPRLFEGARSFSGYVDTAFGRCFIDRVETDVGCGGSAGVAQASAEEAD